LGDIGGYCKIHITKINTTNCLSNILCSCLILCSYQQKTSNIGTILQEWYGFTLLGTLHKNKLHNFMSSNSEFADHAIHTLIKCL